MLFSILGAVRNGKTLFLAEKATKFSRPIYSNFKLNVPNYKKLEIDDLLNLPNNVNVFIDEGYTWLESRASGRNLNKAISYILFQSGKKGLDIYLTAQLFSSVDLRFREQSDYLIYCRKKSNYFRYKIYNRETGRTSIKILPFKNAQKYFSVYDTYEIIEPVNKMDLEYELIKDNKPKMDAKLLEISIKITEVINKYTKSAIKYGLWKLGYSLKYSELLHLILNEYVKVEETSTQLTN